MIIEINKRPQVEYQLKRLRKTMNNFNTNKTWAGSNEFWFRLDRLKLLGLDLEKDYQFNSDRLVKEKYGFTYSQVEILPKISDTFKKSREYKESIVKIIKGHYLPSKVNFNFENEKAPF